MNDDLELLRRYVTAGDEAAFRQVVDRYLPLVYSAASRQVWYERHLIEDVVQGVFVDLARQAGSLSPNVVLSGWLFRATRFVAGNLLRGERRRRDREAVAATEQDSVVPSPGPDAEEDQWHALRQHLDEAVLELGEKDRAAILLRFFHNADFRTVGAALQVSDDTAQKRVARALDKLRELLAQRGVALSSAGLGAWLASQAVLPPPAQLAESLVAALKGASPAAGSGVGSATSSLLRGRLGMAIGVAVLGLLLLVPWLGSNRARLVTYDLSRDFSPTNNPNGVWAFGWKTALGGAFTAMPQPRNYWADNRSPLTGWEAGPFQPPTVVRNMGPGPAFSGNGAFAAAPGCVWFGVGPPGDGRNYSVIRFTAPPDTPGELRIAAAVHPSFTGPDAGDADFHVLKNGAELFSRILAPDAGTAYNGVVALAPGDTIEFVTGRGRTPDDPVSGLFIVARITTDPAASAPLETRDAMIPPVIAFPPWDQADLEGTTATLGVTAGGSRPLSYQWWSGGRPLPAATNAECPIDRLAAGHLGDYFVTVSNAVGTVTSGVARVSVATCAPAPSRLVGWWSANDSTEDSVGGTPGTLLPGTSLAAGRVGRAFRFDGTNSGVQVPASAALDVGSRRGLTIEAWIKPEDAAAKRPLAIWEDARYAGIAWVVEFGQLIAVLMDRQGRPHKILIKDAVIVAGRWQHVALTYDRINGLARLFHNGRMAAEENLGVIFPESRPDLHVGYWQAKKGTHRFAGLIDEFSIYSRALEPSELAAIVAAGGAGKCAQAPAAAAVASPPSGLAAQP